MRASTCHWIGRVVFVAALGVGPGATAPVFAETPFVFETVDDIGDVGQYSSLALDAAGNAHICYFDDTDDDLKYVSQNAGIWTVETVDNLNVGWYTSLALDADDNPHISYYGMGAGNLKYAHKSGGRWSIETVDVTGDVGLYTSLALDAEGNPHISYHDETGNLLKYATKSGGGWTIETADPGGGEVTSIALDALGRPHISYIDGSSLRYTYRAGGSWSTPETVSNSAMVSNSLALDSDGNPHISYFEFLPGYLACATKSGGTWTIENVDGSMSMASNSLVLDADGTPHISYRNVVNDLIYACKSGGSWTIETVDWVGDVGEYSSLALDVQGNPRISYYDATNGGLKYADSAVHLTSPVGGERWAAGSAQEVRWSGTGTVGVFLSGDGGLTYERIASSISSNTVVITVPDLTTDRARVKISRSSPFSTSESPGHFSIASDLVSPWWSEIAEATGSVGSSASLALDAQGTPHVAYLGDPYGTLKYGYRSGGTWVTEVVPADAAWRVCLVLDASGNPHLSFPDPVAPTDYDMKYAYKSGGSWTFETVDVVGDVGHFNSLALDAEGNPHVCYYDGTSEDLKYAYKSGGVWGTPEVVDATGDVGQYCWIAVDAYGDPHISYSDNTVSSDHNLKYAHKSGGSWTVETVDDAGDVGDFTSIALDSQGNPHISYTDWDNEALKYAFKTAGDWNVEIVPDVPGHVPECTSLKLDAKGDPHISYYDGGPYDLGYAHKSGGTWFIETVDDGSDVGIDNSIALDAQGNPHICYSDIINDDLKYASAAIGLGEPSPGTTWPVGAQRRVTWGGTGRVNLYLSADGGGSYDLLASDITGGVYGLVVPHSPSRFCRIKLERELPWSVAVSDSFFTIETEISLLALTAMPAGDGGPGVVISWETEPGPEDLAGYRLARSLKSENWRTIVALTRETSYVDTEGTDGARYRLYGVNGLGEELLLGETSFGTRASLAAWPLPFRGGELTISYTPSGDPGGALSPATITLHDAAGRLIRTIARGLYPQGGQRVVWDGLDDGGRTVPAGLYFLRAESPGNKRSLKVLVVQ